MTSGANSSRGSCMDTLIRLITLDEYLMGRDHLYPISDELRQNAEDTVHKVNILLSAFGKFRNVTSGYRPKAINDQIKMSAKHSLHETCQACDLRDWDGRLDRFCVENQNILGSIGLWLESPTDTKGWCHLQTMPPLSGHRIFIA